MPAHHPRRVALDGTSARSLGRNSCRKLSQEIMDTMPEELSSREREDLYINPPWSISLGSWKVKLVPPVYLDEADHTSSFVHNNIQVDWLEMVSGMVELVLLSSRVT